MLFHSLSFWGSTRSFSISVCLNSRFLTFFILFFAPLPFALYFCGKLLFALWNFARCFLILGCFISCLFGAVLALFQYLFVSTVVSLPFCVLPFAPLPFFSFAFGTFRPLPFEILPVVFLFSVVSFAVFLGRSSLFFNVCLFQQRFSYLFYIVFCPLPLSFAFETFCALPFSILKTAFCPLPFTSPFCCFLSFLCVEFTFCVTFDGNLLQKFVTRQKV